MNWKATGAIALTLMIAVPLGLGYILAVDDEEITGWESTTQYNISDLLLNHSTPFYQEYTGPQNNTLTSATYIEVSSTNTSIPIYEQTSKSISLSTSYRTVPDDPRYSMSFDRVPLEIKVTKSDGTTETHIITVAYGGSLNKSFNGTTTLRIGTGPTTQDTFSYPFAQKVELKITVGSGTLSYTAWVATGTYADPNAGWKAGTEGVTWANGFNNEYAVFSVEFVGNTLFAFGDIGASDFLYLRYADGTAYYSPIAGPEQALGTYSALRVTINKDTATIEGLNSWVPLGQSPVVYNSATIDIPERSSVSRLHISNGHDMVRVRCDSAQIPAGEFPSTLDYTLNLSSLFPDSMMTVKLNSIGIYGDSLAIGSESFDVTDGRITVDGRKVPLKGAMISFLPDEDGTVTGRINSVEVGSFESVPSVTFGGEWSLTAIAYKVEEVSETNLTWQPGGFGLDREGFAAVGLLTAGAVFVVLGMQGRMNSTKVGVLLMVCGGAAFAYFSFI